MYQSLNMILYALLFQISLIFCQLIQYQDSSTYINSFISSSVYQMTQVFCGCPNNNFLVSWVINYQETVIQCLTECTVVPLKTDVLSSYYTEYFASCDNCLDSISNYPIACQNSNERLIKFKMEIESLSTNSRMRFEIWCAEPSLTSTCESLVLDQQPMEIIANSNIYPGTLITGYYVGPPSQSKYYMLKRFSLKSTMIANVEDQFWFEIEFCTIAAVPQCALKDEMNDSPVTACVVCNNAGGYYAVNSSIPSDGQCYSTYPGYFVNANSWTLCFSVGCLECTGYGSIEDMKCITCKENFALVENTRNCFSSTLPRSGYYLDMGPPLLFKPCYATCTECSGPLDDGNQHCTSCKAGFAQIEGSSNCYSTSSNFAGYYLYSGTPMIFKPCYDSCDTCSGPLIDANQQCTQCKFFYGQMEGTSNCYLSTSSIPGYYLYDGVSFMFKRCYLSCATCSGPLIDDNQQCTSCSDTFALMYNTYNCYLSTTSFPGYYLDNGPPLMFKPCYDNCVTCSGPLAGGNQQCITCKDTLALMSNTYNCYLSTTSFPGYYLDNGPPLMFKPCYESCATCSGALAGGNQQCLSCKNNFTPVDGTYNCYPSNNSVPGYYLDSGPPLIFKPCYFNCATCSGPLTSDNQQCTSCKDTFAPVDGTSNCYPSVTSVPGYYLDNGPPLIFKRCYESCATCSGPLTSDNQQCTSCKDTFTLIYNTSNCYPSNSSVPGYYLDNGPPLIFKPCYDSCATCSGPLTVDNQQCIACKDTFALKSNTYNCYLSTTSFPGYYLDNGPPLMFKPCYDNCATCSGPLAGDNQQCIACKDTFALMSNTYNCYLSTTSFPGYYLDNGPPLMFKLCYDNCATCSGPLTGDNQQCITCKDTFALIYNTYNCDPSNSSVPGYYLDSGPPLMFKPCYDSCATCSGPLTGDNQQCITCKNTFALKSSTHNCYPSNNSVPGYYLDNGPPLMFKLCYDNCATCSGPLTGDNQQCITCKNTFALMYNTYNCYPSNNSVPGYYLDNGPPLMFKLCYDNCATCSGPLTGDNQQCITCKNTFALKSSTYNCYPSTTSFSGYYMDNGNEWIFKPCYDSCDACSGPLEGGNHHCISCKETFANMSGTSNCYPSNSFFPGYYLDNVTELMFKPCYDNCATCSGPLTGDNQQCITCKYTYAPLEGTSNCASISVEIPGYYLFNQTDSYEFKPCDDSCATCSGPREGNNQHCTSCKDFFCLVAGSSNCTFITLDLLFIDLNKCVKSCPDGYFENETARYCDKCSEECSLCTRDKEFCLACSPDLFLLSNACLQKCPDGFYEDNSTMVCMPCYERCKTCRKGGKTNCITCLENYPYYKNGECQSGCQADEIQLLQENKCKPVTPCIKYFTIDIPYSFSIEYSDLTIKVTMELTKECLQYQNLITIPLSYNWTEPFKGTVSDGGSVLTIPVDNLMRGLKTFTVTIKYNTVILSTLIRFCQFKNNRLIPVVKNSDTLSAVFGYPIILDGSLSFDEGMIENAITSNIDDPDLHFQWQCPNEINVNCTSKSDKILKLSSDDYSGLKENIQKVEEYHAMFKLYLFKGSRTSQLEMKVAISNPFFYNSEAGKNNYEKLIVIFPRLRGMKGEDYIFDVLFKDETIDKNQFGYFWTVREIEDPEKYLNGRNEDVLRFRNDDLLLGDNKLSLKFYEKDSPENKYFTTYTYVKAQAPYGGNCQANPNSGFSLKTAITFSAYGWQSTNLPLSYKFYMTTLNGFQVSLTDDIIPMTEYTTSIIPVGTEFFLEVIDSAGLMTTCTCSLAIEPYNSPENINQEPLSLNDMLEKMSNPKLKLLLTEAFNSNDFPLDSKGVENTAALLENIVDTTNEKTIAKSIYKNMDIILSQLDSISVIASSEPSVTEKVDNAMTNVINNMDSIVQDHNKVEGLVNIINNNIANSTFSEKTRRLSDSSDSLLFGVKKTALIVKNVNYLKQVQINSFANMVRGQTIIISNKNFICQTGKISKNINSYSIIDDSSLFTDTTVKIRRLQLSNEESCLPGSAVCITSDMLKNISSQISGDLGIFSILNKASDILPITEESFSTTSLNMQISQQKLSEIRLLSSNELNISYTIRLKAPFLNSSSVIAKINDTACVQYDEKLSSDSKSCTTWYDYDMMEIVCICTKQGLTVNVLDKTFSSFSKLGQFPVNVYSLAIVGSLILLFVFFLGVGHSKDKVDQNKKIYMSSQQFDIMQYYIIQYTKEGFDKDYSFWNFYRYILKTNHPILSIVSIYSPTYYRSLRVLDFFLNIYISLFFTFLPLYATDNDVKIQHETFRNVKDIGVRFDQFSLTVQQIINSVLYSLVSMIFSTIISLPLTLLIYSDVLKGESENRKNVMQRMVRYYLTQRKPSYAEKSIRGLKKLRFLIIFSRENGQKYIPENCFSPINRLKTVNILIPPEPNRNSKLEQNEIFAKENEYEKLRQRDKKSEREMNSFSLSMNSKMSLSFKICLEESPPQLPENDIHNDLGLEEMRVGSLEFHAIHNNPLIFKKSKYYSIRNGERRYLFTFLKDCHFKVSCSYYNYCRTFIDLHGGTKCQKILSIIKFAIIIGLDILIWYYLLVFIVGIYENFGTQIVKLCLIPLLSVVFKLVILTCLMLFVATWLMFYYGPQIYSRKMSSIKVILFNLLVPPIASNHHRGILLYRTIIRALK